MIKSVFLTIIMVLCVVSSVQAKTVEINSGNWIFDKYRRLVVDDFDYLYSLQATHLRGRFIELNDGSIWQVEEQGRETKAFYESREEPIEISFMENLVNAWQPGEKLIFHKVFNGENLLVYNLDRDLLIDVAPFLPPYSENSLIIAAIDFNQHLLTLSDGSVWEFNHLCRCKKWKVGNPILVVKNTAWNFWPEKTHVLVNLIPCECEATVEHIHPNHLEVNHANP